MSEETTRKVMNRYWKSGHGDVSSLADDATFTLLATGDTARGRQAVKQMLDDTYHRAFEARGRARNTLVFDGHAVWEGHFVGKHTGQFAGIAPTGKKVCVPLCIVYDLEDDKIEKARIYLEMPVLLKQLGVQE